MPWFRHVRNSLLCGGGESSLDGYALSYCCAQYSAKLLAVVRSVTAEQLVTVRPRSPPAARSSSLFCPIYRTFRLQSPNHAGSSVWNIAGMPLAIMDEVRPIAVRSPAVVLAASCVKQRSRLPRAPIVSSYLMRPGLRAVLKLAMRLAVHCYSAPQGI